MGINCHKIVLPHEKAKISNLYKKPAIRYHINDLNAEKNHTAVVTWTSDNMQSKHVQWEPHTNQDEVFSCILPYLIDISDFSWLKVFIQYTILLGAILQSAHTEV